MPAAHRSGTGATSVGEAVDEMVTAPGAGRVVGVFAHGFYIERRGELAAIVDATVAPGPLHCNVESLPVRPADGDRVLLTDTSVTAGPLRIDLAGAHRYRPTIPPDLGSCRSRVGTDTAEPPDHLADRWVAVEAAARSREIEAVGRLLWGRGPGPTPVGDDVLAGMLVVLAAGTTIRPRLHALASTAATTDLSRAFLRWAAVGQSVKPVHDLLWAGHRDDPIGWSVAIRAVRSIGSSTGPAMLAGLALGVRLVTAESGQTAASGVGGFG